MGDKIEALRIVTKCKSVAELVAAFEPYVDAESCFIPNKHARPAGTEVAFSIRLADGTPVLRGAGIVRDMWTDDANPFGRPGMRITIGRIAPQSRALFERLKPQRRETSSIPITALHEKTQRAAVAERGVKTVEMSPVGHRTPGSPIIIPANPFFEISDDTLNTMVDCTLAEDTDDAVPVPLEPVPAMRRPRERPPQHTLRGMPPLTPPGVPALVMDHGSSVAVHAHVAPMLLRWSIAVMAFALAVALLVLR